MNYQRAAVASTFSPTFAAVLAEADSFARFCGANLDIVHAAAFDADKARRFEEAMGREVKIRWAEAESPARGIAVAASDHAYELLIAGALQREDNDRHFTNGVARELLRTSPCDLLLVPHPALEPKPLRHVVFALEPGENAEMFLQGQVGYLRPEAVTIAVTHTPFAAAIAASKGEEPTNLDEWLGKLVEALEGGGVAVETRIVTSNTGYAVYDVIQGLEADLLVIQLREGNDPLPAHMNWLYQVIPTRLLAVRTDRRA